MIDGLTIFTLVTVIFPLAVAFALGFVPLFPSLRHWGKTNHVKMLWGIFISAWFLSWIAVAGFFAWSLYSVANFYFDTTFGQVAGVTRATMQPYTWGVLVETWFHQLFEWLMPSKCFIVSGTTCQLAVEVAGLGSPGISPVIVAVFPALFPFLIARWIVTHH